MRAAVGDRLVIQGHHLGNPSGVGHLGSEILLAHGRDSPTSERRDHEFPACAWGREHAARSVVRLHQVEVQALAPQRLEALIGPERSEQFEKTAASARELLAGRRVLNVNSTARGGGVAELLQTLLAYARGVGVDARWVVIDCDSSFFEITKRIHNRLYGAPGDGGPLGPSQHARYEETMRHNAEELTSLARKDDIVILHDPQTAGLADAARSLGATVVWRCHVGRDTPNEYTEEAWAFLRPYVADVDAYVFSRTEFAPPWVDEARLHLVPPSIDPFSAKNQPLDEPTTHGILQYVGLLSGQGDPPTVSFSRRDGSPGRIDRAVDILQTGPPPPPQAPLVVQVSRWDRMKDMTGVLHGFAEHLHADTDVHLALVGPAVHGVADDPEASQVLDECIHAWRELPHAMRSRVHLACVPMSDPDEAAMIVNALQRHASVVTQKSLAEGFGLTVTEAMWKRRPIVASHVGGIADQITDHQHGLLIDDPTDLDAFGSAVRALLDDAVLADNLAGSAHQRALEEFLGDRHLERYARLFVGLSSP
jgi:trehalose synthase